MCLWMVALKLDRTPRRRAPPAQAPRSPTYGSTSSRGIRSTDPVACPRTRQERAPPAAAPTVGERLVTS